MKEPSFLAQMAGTPGAAIPLTLGGMWLVYAWTQGRASVWVALTGCFIVVRTMSCVRQRKRYKAWRTEWDAVGNFGKAPKRHALPAWRLASVLAVVLFIGIIVFAPYVPDSPELQNALTLLWLLSGVFLAAKLVIGLKHLLMKRRTRNGEKAKGEAAPVFCVLNRTLDSPSRDEAQKKLPDYAVCILNR